MPLKSGAPITLIKGDKHGAETDYRDALPVNMAAVLRPVLGAQGYMLQEPGLTQFGSAAGVARGALWNERQSQHYRVQGTSLQSVAYDGTATTLGTVPGDGAASLPYSFNSQAVIAAGRMFLYSPAAGFSEITDPDLGSPIDGVWVDGYYFLTDGEYIYHTDINDESAIDPLKFATSEFSPDPTLGVGLTSDNKVLVFNRYTIEYFTNDATDQFAFQRIANRALKIGIVGTHGKTEVGGAWFILGGRKEESPSIHQLGVGSAQKVATREVDKILGEYSENELAGAVLESVDEDGYQHVLMHLPRHVLKLNLTLAKSAGIEQAWSLRRSDVAGSDAWRGKYGVYDPRRGEWVYGDKLDGRLGLLDSSVATEYDAIVEWQLYTPFLYLEEASIDEFQAETVPGFTTADDATVFFSMTYDGVSYGKEYSMTYGAPGAYDQRFVIRRLGDVPHWCGIKLRGATRSRMAFGLARLHFG